MMFLAVDGIGECLLAVKMRSMPHSRYSEGSGKRAESGETDENRGT